MFLQAREGIPLPLQVGGQQNEQFCPKCFCFVCDVKASEGQGWLAGLTNRDVLLTNADEC